MRANSGSKTSEGFLKFDLRIVVSQIPKMKIPKTAQTKTAFHHGSTVPYGIGVSTTMHSKAPKIILLAK